MRCRRLPAAVLAVIAVGGCNPSSTPPVTAPQATNSVPDESSTTTAVPAEPEAPFELEDGFQLLTLSDFAPFPADADSWSEADGVLSCTGKPRGYLASRASFQNFTWKLDYRFPRPDDLKDESRFKGNTGFMVYVTGESKIWPLSLEVQGKHVQMATIKENGGAEAPVVHDDNAARQSARKPVGQWNALEIESRDGALSVVLNGVAIAMSEPNFLSSGSLGIQSEDFPFEVRRMRVRRDP